MKLNFKNTKNEINLNTSEIKNSVNTENYSEHKLSKLFYVHKLLSLNVFFKF